MITIVGRKLYIYVATRRKCPCCKGERINQAYDTTDDPMVRVERYSGKEVSVGSEEYQVHYDCYVCLDCGCFDFPSAFDYSTRTTETYCPDCQAEKTYLELDWDWYSAQLHIKCVDCGHEYRCQMGRNAEVVEILPN
ncbi:MULTISPECIES: hypothetical protein [Paenibacillus]|uniref:hypothetical protein n=1 Tax=Paenibacillus TaxID=44249 RepID=UPI002280E8BB|nr:MULTISPECIES: hypothetical protein [Paenibacillus]MEB8593759.1 hypothetical protein [Bacillus cereus]MCY7521042.1 hypothetical protein [Paenibacillus larvae]MCY9500680.1 hypothetical protein [Paenibacillus larvae]MCY9677540.1 hypothetical protein [Paenibacillus larvae]MCY9744713.1 hypothetical protein [Paenibacillus larvae]